MQLLDHVDWSVEAKLSAIECALLHDVPEARNGDMPGPVKRAVVDKNRMAAYEDDQLRLMGLTPVTFPDYILDLVKVADLIDELFHVATEISMGNSLIRNQFEVTLDRFNAAVRKAGLPWEIAQMVEEQVADMQRGVDLPKNDPKTDPLTEAPKTWDFEDDGIPF